MLVIGISFAPLFGFGIFGSLMIIFPGAMLNFKNFNASMKGSLFDNNLEFTDAAIITTRIMGGVCILCGIGIFMLVNGWLDSFLIIDYTTFISDKFSLFI